MTVKNILIQKITTLRNYPGLNRYLKNTTWMVGQQLLRIISGLVIGVWIARYLGPENFGIFSYVIAFTSIFSGIAKLGLDSIVIKEILNKEEKIDAYLGTAFWLKILGAFLVIGIIAFILPFTNNDQITNLFIFIIAAGTIFQGFEVVEFYFQSQVLAKVISICKIIQLVLSSIIKIYLILNKADLIYFVLVSLFDSFSLAITYFIAYKSKTKSNFYNQFDFSIAKRLLENSWPLIFTGLVIMIYVRIDQIMIKELLGEYEVGVYSVASRLNEAWHFLPMFIVSSLFPAIVNAKSKCEILYQERLKKLYSLLIWMAIIIAIPITFYSEIIILKLFGQEYLDAAKVLSILIWGGVNLCIGVVWSKWMIVENKQKIIFYGNLVGLVFNIVLNFLLIRNYGILGAASATILSQLIITFSIYMIYKPYLTFSLIFKGLLFVRN